jgi:hypothetical protein
MSQESWEELERKGWRKRISDKNGRVSYLRPREGGRVMVVNQRRDLRDGEESLGDILWPPANKRPMQEEEPEGEEDPVIEEAREVEEAAEVMERAEVREEVLEDSEDGAEDGEDKVEHKVELLNMAGRLKDVSRRDIDIISTGEMMFELDKAMQEHDNPLRQELPLDSKKNFFVEVLKFGLSRAEHLVYTILKLTTTREREFDESTVIATAKIFVIIATAVNPQVNSTYRKKIGVFLQGCGLSSKGIAALHAMGECESERELRRTKTDLAVKDEQNVVAMAKDSTVAIAFDNMDKRAKKTLQHYTLSVLLFLNKRSVAVGATNDGLKLNDVVEKVDYAFLDLGSNKNVQEKEAFMKVTYTVLAKICATIPNFKWAADMFPEAHQHAFKETAQLKTSCHTDPTINLACMKTSDVIQVLKQLIQRFLTLLAERMDEDEKAAYSQALFLVTSEDVEEEEVRAAEQVVKVKLEQYGKLILFGDQKTVEDTQTAIEAMKYGFTELESLAYIMIIIPGDFHLEMSATIKNAEVLLASFSSQNALSLGQLASRLVVSHRLSNDPSVIKKSGNYEENRQFPELVATEMLRDGLATYKAELEAGTAPVIQTKVWLVKFFNNFIKSRQIRVWFDPNDEAEFFDDIHAYASNLVSRYRHNGFIQNN